MRVMIQKDAGVAEVTTETPAVVGWIEDCKAHGEPALFFSLSGIIQST